MQILFPVALLLIFYFLVLPRQRRAQAQRNLGATVEVGDQVVMAGGMIGTLLSRDGERALVEVAPDIEIEFLASAIVRRLDPVYNDGETDHADDADDGQIGDEAFPAGDTAPWEPEVDPAAPTVPVDVTPPPTSTRPELSKHDLSNTDDLRRDDAPRGEEPPVVPPQRGDMT